jgi:type III restriction enzyme
MNIQYANFQLQAIEKLFEGMSSDKKDIVLKSCTGSGKTIILTKFMDEYTNFHDKIVFVWLTPGKGELEEQSKAKMDKYIHGANTKLLADVMTGGFESGDFCFINWEKLTVSGNTAMREGEYTNFIEHVERAMDNGLKFVGIIDESHSHETAKTKQVISYFSPIKIIRSSATPTYNADSVFLVDVSEADVIAEGLVKKQLIINENFPQNLQVENQLDYLLERALTKRTELHQAFKKIKCDVNPLIVIQMPNSSDAMLSDIETYFGTRSITYENNKLAVWLANKKQNDEGISENNAEPIAIIMKQAISLGWDCPRAHILVKLRDNMSETFYIQTIGRIRRMPEVKHYENELLDSCYLYTFDSEFTENVKSKFGNTFNADKIKLKPEHKSFKLICEQKPLIQYPISPAHVLESVSEYIKRKYNLSADKITNKTRFQTAGYVFSEGITEKTKSGSVSVLTASSVSELNEINVYTPLNTHTHGREYHHNVAELGKAVSLQYNYINTICLRLFRDEDEKNKNKVLSLPVRLLYAFVINNFDLLKADFLEAMASQTSQGVIPVAVSEKEFSFPSETWFTYDSRSRSQQIYTKNVYDDYRDSAEPRSFGEKQFEEYCERSEKVEWFYKNGDKGEEYFSIVYNDNFGKLRSFFPDYILKTNDGSVWIIETKGGYNRSGKSEDIDKFTGRKFRDFRRFVDQYGIKGGFVRFDKQSNKLLIAVDEYSDDVRARCWALLTDVM